MVTPAGSGGPRVVLIGPPGAGKSTVAAIVSERLGLPVLDTDAAIEAAAGRSVSDIFVDDGEPAFRVLESDTVLAALTSEVGVVAVGGGAPMTPEVAAALERRTVVFLDVGIADAARRVGFAQARPLLAVNPRASWISMMKERRPTYERLATHVVDTAGRSPDEVAADVVAALEGP